MLFLNNNIFLIILNIIIKKFVKYESVQGTSASIECIVMNKLMLSYFFDFIRN